MSVTLRLILFCALFFKLTLSSPNQLQESTQNSCVNFTCLLQGTVCQERSNSPQCVCQSCDRPQTLENSVCGSDGNAYFSRCFLDKAACERGVVIVDVPCQKFSSRIDQIPTISETRDPQTVFVGSSRDLRCDATGATDTNISWKKQEIDGDLTSSSLEGILISENGAVLSITNAQAIHAGTYQCFLKSGAGLVTIRHEVQIIEEGRCEISSHIQARRCSRRHRHETFWTYDVRSEKCKRISHMHCDAVTNKFETKWECEKICRYQCESPPIQGDCRRFTQRNYFDSQTGTCRAFVYGGCGGNKNNFRHLDSCRRNCITKLPGTRLSCPSCERNIGASFCDDEFAISGIVTKISQPNVLWPYIMLRITEVFKDNGNTMNDLSREDNVIREIELSLKKDCPCPDLEALMYRKTLGSNDAEMIFTGNYDWGIPTIVQGSFGDNATTTNIRRMRANKKSRNMCSILRKLRMLGRT